MKYLYLAVPLACLVPALVTGLAGHIIGRRATHMLAIAGVAAAFVMSAVVFADVRAGNLFNGALYTWAVSDGIRFEIGFLIDQLSALMMVVVTFVSLMVHVYTIGYMQDDPGYQRFFSYISLFTFAMLMLVMSNNFLQLFFGWEAVGLVSYLLIGFWFKKPTAISASLKAFLVNRVGDFGFLLGIAAVAYVFGTLDYAAVFAGAPHAQDMQTSWLGGEIAWLTVICLLLFVGAMGKSAQMPLHVWLPDSMEGPTPISALIHAATMVTAGIFMVARMSPLFELSETALTVVMAVGALTAFFMGLIGMVQNDIKRVVAYSTLSQLGYMTAALGVSAYAAGIFHLGTHAFFKALLFLAAGSVIIALHHEQDMRKMGGLSRPMPITCMTAWVGTLALIGLPPFSGFFSKDSIIEAVYLSELPGSGLTYVALAGATFVTAFYSFRLLFLTFHGKPRMDMEARRRVHEPSWVVTLPLVILAVPSMIAGAWFAKPILFDGFFGGAISVLPEHDTLARLAADYEVGGTFELLLDMIIHGITQPPFILTVLGIAAAWAMYIERPDLPDQVVAKAGWAHRLLMNKYGFDDFNDRVFAAGARSLGKVLWRACDATVIDGWLVNGSARLVGRLSTLMRRTQTGYVYHYAFAMILGLFGMLSWLYFDR